MPRSQNWESTTSNVLCPGCRRSYRYGSLPWAGIWLLHPQAFSSLSRDSRCCPYTVCRQKNSHCRALSTSRATEPILSHSAPWQIHTVPRHSDGFLSDTSIPHGSRYANRRPSAFPSLQTCRSLRPYPTLSAGRFRFPSQTNLSHRQK